jgi:DNA topoisomerase II
MSSKKQVFTEKSLHDHILLRSDTYVGSKVRESKVEWIFNEGKFTLSQVKYIPAFYRIFIEILSNAIDNVWRSEEEKVKCTCIKVNIDPKSGRTSIWNDGSIIPIEHAEDEKGNKKDYYIPEMIFGRLLTGSNYDDTQERKTSGRNGYGAKLTNIFSSIFSVSLSDGKKRYYQEWKNNMKVKNEANVTLKKETGFTEVIWYPDFEHFKMKDYQCDDILSVMFKAVYDAALIIKIPVYLNETKIHFRSLIDYSRLYPFYNDENMLFHSKDSNLILISSSSFSAISFVNGVNTVDGGVHVDKWCEAIFRPIVESINKKQIKKKGATITIKDVRQHFSLILNCSLDKPAFTSQSKTKLTSPSPLIDVKLSHIKQLLKWSFVNKIFDSLRLKEMALLKKSTDKRKKEMIEGLDHANNAGKRVLSRKCVLIICEGISAKQFAVKGIDVGFADRKGRDYFGIYPIRGKLLNTRNAVTSKLDGNREIKDIISALNLKFDVDYSSDANYDTLNYGQVMILADADADGKHIEGLILNFFHSLFPSLFFRTDPPFFISMKTPILKLPLSMKNVLYFYTKKEYVSYVSRNSKYAKKEVKYLKGLGSSNNIDIKSSFGKKLIKYEIDNEIETTMNKVFHKDFSDKRKEWLQLFDPNQEYEYEVGTDTFISMKVSEFLDTEMIHFSIEDCKRNIPNMIDGLKESQRKILFTAFKRRLNKSIKVYQLASFVSGETNYHYGEQNLQDTIIKMAQTFVGSNNVSVFYEDGQFGSRLQGGKDAASARYIHTRLTNLARLLFRPEDDDILSYREDEGQSIEPYYYVPILPFLLINGCTVGIGTGWSTSIPCYDPIDIINQVRIWIECEGNVIHETDMYCFSEFDDLIPWYNGFEGKIEKVSENKFVTSGIFSEGIKVTELPVGLWLDKFKEFLESLKKDKLIKDFRNNSTDNKANFTITESAEGIKCNLNTLKLTSYLNATNLVFFNESNKLSKFESIDSLIDDFCKVRYAFYVKRRTHILNKLKHQLLIASNKYRFISEIIEGNLILSNKEDSVLSSELEERKFTSITDSDTEDDKIKGYLYLLKLPIRSMTKKKLDELNNEIEKITTDINYYTSKSEYDLWLEEINEFESEYKKAYKRA